jgi:hypothetical protein
MRDSSVKRLSPMDRLLYWIRERESIREKRLKDLPLPWTDDKILQTYRFCNVVRIDDAVSQWLLNHWYLPNLNHPNMLVACALARFINQPGALEVVGFPQQWYPLEVKQKLRNYREAGGQVFNSAYMVRGNDGRDKIESVVDYYVDPLFQLRGSIFYTSMQDAWETILGGYGLGSFMAGQIIADMRWGVNGSWVDKRCWAPMGPGSRRGLKRLGIETSNQEEFMDGLRFVQKSLRPQLPRKLTKRMEAIDWQNCLCEYDKYVRTLFCRGKPKRRFNPCH